MAADAMDVDLNRATRKLYVDLDTVTKDYVIEDDGMGNMTLLIAGAKLPIMQRLYENCEEKRQ